MKDILLTGGEGLLGTELLSINKDMIAPTREELDITNLELCKRWVNENNFDILIHAAALTSPPVCDKNPELAREVNVGGTLNMLKACKDKDKKFVYISTDYVFDGRGGPYDIDDAINPINTYAITKAAAELAVKTYSNSLIIRTSFCERVFPYEKAFIDQYTSRDYIDVIAPMILSTAVSNKKGIVHIGTHRKTVYDLAQRRSPLVGKLKRSDVNFNVPADTSFK